MSMRKFLLTDQDAVMHRRSRRSYKDLPVEGEKAEALKELIGKLNEESGLRICFLEDGRSAFAGLSKSYGMFKGVRSLIVIFGRKADEDRREKCGYYGEKLVLEATKRRLGTCWVGGTFDRKDGLFQAGEEEELICVITVGEVREELSFKENLLQGLIHRKSKSEKELCSFDEEPPEWFWQGMRLVAVAPSAKNSQKFRFHYFEGRVCADIAADEYFDMVDLGIAKLHFEIGAGGRFEWGKGAAYRREEESLA